MPIRVLRFGVEVAVKCLLLGDKVVQRLPGMSAARGFMLDTFLGPEESLEYTRTTALNNFQRRN